MVDSKLTVDVFVSQMFEQNAYILSLDGSSDCIVIDPGFDSVQLMETLKDKGFAPSAILNTHGHIDHVAGNEKLKQQWPKCPIIIGEKEAGKLTDSSANLSGDFGLPLTSPPADRTVKDDETLCVARIELFIAETPGHSPGHVVYIWKGDSPWILFCGDVLFRGSIGRADFPDSNPQQLQETIRTKLYTLPDDTIVMPGHGESTTIGREKRTNPFVRL